MNIDFFPIDESYNAIQLEFASPEEMQTYLKAIPDTIPEGHRLATRMRKTPAGRKAILIGVAKNGQPLRLKGEDQGEKPQKLPPTPPAEAIELPEVVRQATDERLKTMAGANGIDTSRGWDRKNRRLREIAVAHALKATQERERVPRMNQA